MPWTTQFCGHAFDSVLFPTLLRQIRLKLNFTLPTTRSRSEDHAGKVQLIDPPALWPYLLSLTPSIAGYNYAQSGQLTLSPDRVRVEGWNSGLTANTAANEILGR